MRRGFAPAAVLAGAALFIAAQRGALTRARSLDLLIPPAASLALLAGYHLTAFGALQGPFTSASAGGASAGRSAMAILGLHLDQEQGIFLQQPLFLLGCLGLVAAFRASAAVMAPLALAYASVIVANGVHFDTYGGFALGGRFMWTVAALWFVPLVFLYRGRGAAGRRVIRLCCALAIAAQVALMTYWAPGGPAPLRTAWAADLPLRNSWFPAAMRGWLPSFYDPDDLLSHPQNLWWIASVAALVLIGATLTACSAKSSPSRIDNPRTLP
jgi:hypothetical protein